jgi:hypothetical protein
MEHTTDSIWTVTATVHCYIQYIQGRVNLAAGSTPASKTSGLKNLPKVELVRFGEVF